MPMPAADASVPDPAAGDRVPPPDCGCEPTSEKYCKVIEVACRADPDCAPLFSCRQSVTATMPAAGPCFVPPGADGGTCQGAPQPPQPPTPVYRCEPPYQSVDVDSISSGHKSEQGYPAMTPNTSNPTTTTSPPLGKPVPGTNPDAGAPRQASGGATSGQPEAAPVPQTPRHVKSCATSTPGATGSNLSIWVALAALAVVSRAWRCNRRSH